MGVSALRVAACAGVLIGGLILGDSGAGLAFADPADMGHGSRERESSKDVNNERPSLSRMIDRILSEHRKRTSNAPRRAPRAKIGSEPDSGFTASESNVATSAEAGDDPDPELLVPITSAAPNPAEQEGVRRKRRPAARAGGAPNGDRRRKRLHRQPTVAEPRGPKPRRRPPDLVGYPFLYYLLEIRRGGGDWWNADQIISRLGKL